MDLYTLHNGNNLDILKTLPDKSVNCVVTSPPYYNLRDYGMDEQIGNEETPSEFIQKLVLVFREIKRVLTDDGVIWVNMGDSYEGSGKGRNADGSPNDATMAGKQGTNRGSAEIGVVRKTKTAEYKPKDLMGIPWRLAFALQDDGWYLRQDIIWHKANCMPEPVKDRCVKAHEYIFLLSKNRNYYFDHLAIQEDAVIEVKHEIRFGGSKYGDSDDPKHATKSGNVYVPSGKRNKRSVWSVPTKPFSGAHFATFPPDLIEPCILAGCPVNGVVLDPFAGSGTTMIVAAKNKRHGIGIELNPEYCEIARKRIESELISPKVSIPRIDIMNNLFDIE